jgi:hypothetical protein
MYMKTSNSITRAPKMTAVALALSGLFVGMGVGNARAVEPTQNTLTSKQAKKLAGTTESREDHLRLATYFRAKADRLESKAVGYENAAAEYRQNPLPKNLMAPNTAARYESFAKTFHAEAQSDYARATSHEQMANAGAGF